MTPCSVYNWGSWPGQGRGGGITAREQAEHEVPGGEQLHCASLTLYILLLVLLLLLFLLSLCCPVKLSLSQPTSSHLFLLILLPRAGEEWASSCMVLSCRLGLNHDREEKENTWFSLCCWESNMVKEQMKSGRGSYEVSSCQWWSHAQPPQILSECGYCVFLSTVT